MAGSAPELTALAPRLRKALLKIDGVVESPGIFGEGDAFWVNGKQMANFTGVDSVEIRMTRQEIRARRDALQVDPRVTLRSSSDWIGVRFTMAKDLRFVIDLAEVAASVYRAPSGATPAPPPDGAKLARMRRFH